MANFKAVYMVIEREGLDKAIWTRIGTAFVNKDDSLNVYLDAVPVDGKLHIREVKKRDYNQNQPGQQQGPQPPQNQAQQAFSDDVPF